MSKGTDAGELHLGGQQTAMEVTSSLAVVDGKTSTIAPLIINLDARVNGTILLIRA